MVEKHIRLIHDAIAILIAEFHHSADRCLLPSPVRIGHVAAHLHHPEIAVRIKSDLDRISDQWFAGHEVDSISRLENERILGCLGRQRRRWGKPPLFRELPL